MLLDAVLAERREDKRGFGTRFAYGLHEEKSPVMGLNVH